MTRVSEPTTLEEMNARKKAADERQAAAARAHQAGGKPSPAPSAPAPVPAAAETAPPMPAPRVEPAPAAPFDPATASGRQIIVHVAARYGLTYDDLVGESRRQDIVLARREAMGAVHTHKAHLSLPQIGKLFGDRDHTTVLHALRELGLKTPGSEGAAAEANRADPDGMRAISALDLGEIAPAEVSAVVPRFKLVAPRTLLVDARYQRDLSKQSLALIRRIVEQWSWSAFKAPVVVEVEGALHVIDGQHTSIAAATHPGIAMIPVMIVEAERREDRADAFVRHNRDRVRMSGQQLYHALVAAGDPVAVAVGEVCAEAGARVLRGKPAAIHYQPGDTMAVEALSELVRHRGRAAAQRVVAACVQARLTPIRAHEMKAVETLLFDPDHAGRFDEAAIAGAFLSLGPKAEREAAVFAAQHRVPRSRGLAVTLARVPRRARKAGEGDAA